MKDFLFSYARKATVAFLGSLGVAVLAVTADGAVHLAECIVSGGGVIAATLAVFAVPNGSTVEPESRTWV